ncbi:hypothetical protein ASG29_03135 [Sphingomonas sp. Leaf412]|nr:hypothetical protein ASG29_03135 [Sphingomonas sp. Leaf412]
MWLMTLADLALLLVGFFVLMQANTVIPSKDLARGIAEGFGAAPAPAPIAVDAHLVAGFAPGAADLPGLPAPLVAWATAATRDPRVALTVTGAVDGSAADTDRATRSATLLAADRARAVLAALAAAGVPVARAAIATAPIPAGRRVVVTLAFAGEGEKKP